MRKLVLLVATLVSLSAAHGQPFRHPLLDSLIVRMEGNGTEENLDHIDKALRAAGPEAPPRLAYFLHRYRCEQLYYQGLLDESMIDAQKARRIADELHDSLLISSSLNQVAVLMEERNDHRGAITLLREALRWYPFTSECAYPITLPHRIHGNLGRCWGHLGELDSARFSEGRSLRLAENANIPRGISLALIELGRLKLRSGDVDSALMLIVRGVDTARVHAIHDVWLDGLGSMADLFVRNARSDEAIRAFESAHALIRDHPDIAQRSIASYYAQEIRLHSDAGRFQEALGSARNWRTLDSAIRSSSALTAQRTLATLHATDAALATARYRADQAASEVRAELVIRRTVQIGGSVMLVLLAVLVAIYIGRGRQKDRLERLSLQRLELDRQIADLRVRQQVAADLHDDLGAGLSALKLHCELAEDLSTTAATRTRNHTLSVIAGDLIAGMRHILWSLNNTEATVAETTTYVTDRTRAFCAEHERVVRINVPLVWPTLVPDAELRHLAWALTKEALSVMLSVRGEEMVELTMSWHNGLMLSTTLHGPVDPLDRKALSSALAAHHLRVSRTGGTLRTTTEGPLQMDAFLPLAHAATNSAKAQVGMGVILLLGLASMTPAVAQDNALYSDPLLDSLFSPPVQHLPPATRLRLINKAIGGISGDRDIHLECDLLLARAKELYYQGLYDVGIADVSRSLLLAQEMKDSLLIATTYNMFGLLYENLGNTAITLPWFQQAGRWLPQDTRSNYPVVKDYHIDGNIAQCLLNLGRTDSAEYHFLRSRTAARAIGDLRAQALAELGLARIHLRRNELDSSEVLLASASSHALMDGSHDVYVDILPITAEVRLRSQGRTRSIQTLDEALAFIRADSTIAPVSRRNYFKQASRLREELGQYEEAMTAWRLWQREDSSIHAQNGRASLAILKIMLDNDQRLLDERADLQRTRTRLMLDRKQRRIMVTAAGTSALLMLGILIIYAGRRRNLQRMTALERGRSVDRKELAELRVRQRLSEEMHEELGAGLKALKQRSELAIEGEPDPDDRERLARIALQSGELIGSMRQIIWALDTGRSSLPEAVHYTVHYARNYAAQQGLTLRLHLSDQWPDIQLTMEQRRNGFLVVKEALHNIVKHAGATTIDLHMTYAQGLSVEISDNGRGLSGTKAKDEGNGLRNMRRRIETIGGTLEMEGNLGTTIRFNVPLMEDGYNLRSKKKKQG